MIYRKQRKLKRFDAKNNLPVGINYAAIYCNTGEVIEQGRVRASCGRSNMKSFSVKKYGKFEAIKLAIAWRNQQLERRSK